MRGDSPKKKFLLVKACIPVLSEVLSRSLFFHFNNFVHLHSNASLSGRALTLNLEYCPVAWVEIRKVERNTRVYHEDS